jgi:hypothetical protein
MKALLVPHPWECFAGHVLSVWCTLVELLIVTMSQSTEYYYSPSNGQRYWRLNDDGAQKNSKVQGQSMKIQLRLSGNYHRTMTKRHYQLGLCQQYFRSLCRLHCKQHPQNDYNSPHSRRPWSQSQTTHDVVFLTPSSANNDIILGYFIGKLWIAISCRLDYGTNVEHSHNRERFSSGKCQMTVVK